VSVPILLAVLALLGCTSESTTDLSSASPPCERLAAHLVELELAPSADQLAPRDLEQHRAALLDVAKRDFVPACTDELSRRDLDCQLAARDLSTARACLEATP
jgi:hypothetical protein